MSGLAPVINQNKDLNYVPPTGQVILGYTQMKHIKEEVLKVTDNFTEKDYQEYLDANKELKNIVPRYVDRIALQDFRKTRKIDQHFIDQFLSYYNVSQELWDLYFPLVDKSWMYQENDTEGRYRFLRIQEWETSTENEQAIMELLFAKDHVKVNTSTTALAFLKGQFHQQLEFNKIFKTFKEDILDLSTEELEEFLTGTSSGGITAI